MAGPHAQLLPRREMQIWRQVGEIDHALKQRDTSIWSLCRSEKVRRIKWQRARCELSLSRIVGVKL
jgi:hypothetical protein